MKNKNEKREQRSKKNQQVNGWKWAFIVLVVFILTLFLLFIRALQPVERGIPNQQVNEVAAEIIELSTRMDKEDTEQLINTYLSLAAGEDYEGYHIALTDQLEIHGAIEFLGFDVPFSLFFDPYVMENGNVQLRGEAVEVADFSLPVNMVMRLVGNQVAFPEFIAFDSESQIILINLNELTEDYNFDVEMTTIDLIDSVIELNLRLDDQVILEQIQNDRMKDSCEE